MACVDIPKDGVFSCISEGRGSVVSAAVLEDSTESFFRETLINHSTLLLPSTNFILFFPILEFLRVMYLKEMMVKISRTFYKENEMEHWKTVERGDGKNYGRGCGITGIKLRGKICYYRFTDFRCINFHSFLSIHVRAWDYKRWFM